ncbi:HEAT repeat domain-containing protein [Candidatus Poribacteria bacterium]|nr:HEAT repeat domain-containing protein [Candidatus Poribacteria bacterium]
MKDTKSVTQLIAALGGKSKSVRRAAIKALAKTGEPAVRCMAIQALGAIGDPAAVPELIAALKDKNRSVRYMAIRALGAIGDPAAVLELIAALKDKNKWVHRAAIQALGAIGDPAVPALIAALKAGNEFVCYMAIQALAEIGEPVMSALIEALRSGESQRVRDDIRNALSRINDPTAKAALATLKKQEKHTEQPTNVQERGKYRYRARRGRGGKCRRASNPNLWNHQSWIGDSARHIQRQGEGVFYPR